MAPEPNDIVVLIPRVRRAIDGPAASGSAAPSSTLDDNQVRALVADALGEVIFFTNGDFPHTLDVASRDETYGAPETWTINPPLSESEATVVAAQAALSYFFFSLRDLKTSETIRDEGQEWSYSLSATLLRDQIAYLRAARDKALEKVTAAVPVLETYASYVRVRDSETSGLIEDYVTAT